MIFRHRVLVAGNFSFPIASSWGVSNLISTSFFSRVRRVEVITAKFDMKFPESVIVPNNCLSSFTEFSNNIFVIASIFAGLTYDIICLRNTMHFTPI